MSFAARLATLERGTFVGGGIMETHFTEAGILGRQNASPCNDQSHGPNCAFLVQPSPVPGRFILIYEGVGLPG